MDNNTIEETNTNPEIVNNFQPAPPPPSGFSFFQNNKKKVLFAVGGLIAILILLLGFFAFAQKKVDKEVVVKEPGTWEVNFSYDYKKRGFTLNKLTLLQKKINPDYRSAKFSEFELQLVDSQNKVLYSAKVPVITELPDSGGFTIDAPSPTPSDAPKISSNNQILYVPQLEHEKKIRLMQNGKSVLEVDLPKTSVKNFSVFFSPKKVYAEESCQPLVVAFISDNYTDMNQYHKDVDKFIDAFENTEPYSSIGPGMFDFRIIDNNQSLGCGTTGLRYCMAYNTPLMARIANNSANDISKVVVIANGPERNPNDGGVLGISSGIGGSFAVFPNNYGNVTATTLVVARHEFLGHATGLLYDRYVTNASVDGQEGYGLIQNGLRSNCTDSASGEDWWKTAGASTVVQGCGNQFATYGSSALTCESKNPALISGGNKNTIMSAVGCAATNFDAVEQYWITNNVLTDYASCKNRPVTPRPTSTQSNITPGPSPQEAANNIIGTVFTDTNNNHTQDPGEQGYQGAKIDISGAKTASANSDASGNFSFNDVPAGSYSLSVTVSSSVVAKGDFSIPDGQSTTQKITIPLNPTQPNPTPIVIAPTVITPTPKPTSVPGGSSGGGGSGGGGGFVTEGTPTPTPDQYFTCVPDPNCAKSKKNIQLCPLICSPQ